MRPEIQHRLQKIQRTRLFLSVALLPPLLFFIFLVLWFHEGFVLIPVAAGLYLYMLAQFFIFQNPSRAAHRRSLDRDVGED